MPQSKYKKPFECTICKKKHYKSAAGLSRHENAKHNNYNIPPIQPYILPESAINEWKKIQYLMHVFVHRRAYKCVFLGFDAYQTISSLLDNYCWGV
ncbi:hypothetical protein C2G38_2167348 [Gigaspora rosea]|uniref:C2H2-type domain-containing protein n=1 Tax=Gigaspora rosea TaxID=44941 RepID=A0A397VSZ6_9GLOM|nr:hypothetical protein C2G38_2167348 [Gigaspora rosea]